MHHDSNVLTKDLLKAIELAPGVSGMQPTKSSSSTRPIRPPPGFTPSCTRSKAIFITAGTGIAGRVRWNVSIRNLWQNCGPSRRQLRAEGGL